MLIGAPIGMFSTAGGTPGFNPSDKSSYVTLSNSNFTVTNTGIVDYAGARGSNGKSSGKWYAEFRMSTFLAGGYGWYGVASSGVQLDGVPGAGVFCGATVGQTTRLDLYSYSPVVRDIATQQTVSTMSSSSVCQLAIDIDNGRVWLGLDNTWLASGNPASGTNYSFHGLTAGTYYLFANLYKYTSPNPAYTINSTQTYSPPSGFQAWS